MKLITSPGNKKFSELAEELLNSKTVRTPAEKKAAAARLIAANPHLSNSTVLPSGTPVIVPDDFAGKSSELPSPGNEAALAAVRQLQGMIPEIRESLTAAYAAGKVQQREFAAGLKSAIGSEQGTKGTKTASRLKAIGDLSGARLADAEKNKAVHASSLSSIAKDLTHFLALHGSTPPAK
jgi:Phage Tail Protein X